MTTSPPQVEDPSTAPAPAATGARPTTRRQLPGVVLAALAEAAAAGRVVRRRSG